MRRRELIPPENLVADGKIHRCDAVADGNHGKSDGSYLLHLNGIPAGGFENHRDGIGWENWSARKVSDLSPAERAAYQARIDAGRKEHAEDVAQKRLAAIQKAMRLWEAAQPAQADHPYLERKGVAPVATLKEIGLGVAKSLLGYAPRSRDELLEGRLLLAPVKVDDALSTMEMIDEMGRKSAIKDGAKTGGYWTTGELPAGDGVGMTLLIGEGVATVLSCMEATGDLAVAALSCGNLLPVARYFRDRYPSARIVTLADLGIGETKATEAAQAVRGLVAVPSFGEQRPDSGADFNDLHAAKGLDAVRLCIEAAAPPTALHMATPSAAPDVAPQPAVPDVAARAVTFPYGGGKFRVDATGVWFEPPANDDGDDPPAPIRICARLDVLELTRDQRSDEWGRLLQWHDPDGKEHTWAMPAELLAGDCADLRRELLRGGLDITATRRARDLLPAYLIAAQPSGRAKCVARVGWCGDVYVRPDVVIGGSTHEKIVYQHTSPVESAFGTAGTVEEWRDNVAALAAGNSRLVFGISVGLAAPLAEMAGADSGGFHVRGGSSTGKTTTLKCAASVWGEPSRFVRTWRATANGLESLAAFHNDSLLVLDELSQIDPREAAQAAYMLANGQGKARMTKAETLRPAAQWRLLFVSSGETTLAEHQAAANQRAHAGQEVRLVDIEADAGAGMGVVEDLHGNASPASLADVIKDAAARYHGAVGLEWLRRIVVDRPHIVASLAADLVAFVAETAPPDAGGQVLRVARRFALVAVAGEMATRYGLTGWAEGEAVRAAQRCFHSWMQTFGGAANVEARTILSQVRAFFEAHGSSRFEAWDADETQRVVNRAGFRRGLEGEYTYYVLPEAFRREVCEGLDAKLATKLLVAAGWLVPDVEGKAAGKVRIPGLGKDPIRIYVFGPQMWADA
jgi:uncharacterized protein (DUF927 family)/phage/plasmid primase-like uncharacterized protein